LIYSVGAGRAREQEGAQEKCGDSADSEVSLRNHGNLHSGIVVVFRFGAEANVYNSAGRAFASVLLKFVNSGTTAFPGLKPKAGDGLYGGAKDPALPPRDAADAGE
jgi:hypothetical protein